MTSHYIITTHKQKANIVLFIFHQINNFDKIGESRKKLFVCLVDPHAHRIPALPKDTYCVSHNYEVATITYVDVETDVENWI